MADRILYIQYTNPASYPPLQHSSRILAEAGWQVRFMGTGAQGSAILRLPTHPNIDVRQIPYCPGGWKQKLHYFRYAMGVLWCAFGWRPQWVYASDTLSSPIALALSFVPGRQVIYHEHDSPERPTVTHEGAASGLSRFQRFLFWSRRRVAARARACIIPSEQRAQSFALEMNYANVQCVWNCPGEAEANSSTHGTGGNELTLWYHGSIVPSQLPETVVRALALLPGTVKLRIAGYETAGQKGYVNYLRELARELGIPDCLEYLGTIPIREGLLQECSRCDVGLALFLGATRQPMVGASNKPFDYLASGLALLVADTPEWRDFFVQPGYGLASDPDSPQSIAAALSWFMTNRNETRAMGEAGRQRILQEWNYETQFAPIQRMLAGENSLPKYPARNELVDQADDGNPKR